MVTSPPAVVGSKPEGVVDAEGQGDDVEEEEREDSGQEHYRVFEPACHGVAEESAIDI